MKYYFLLVIFLLFSCEEKTKAVIEEDKTEEKKVPHVKIDILKDISTTDWFQYYKKFNPDFNPDLFKLQQTSEINYQKATVAILHDDEFNEIYIPFLIFNKSKTHYLDFDSYHWFVDEHGNVSFEADQQLALVNVKEKTAKQIGFYGPSYQIEDAFWKGDSVAVLLGNSYEKVPFLQKFNFKENTVKHYQYADTLQFKTPFSTVRLNGKGIKVD